MEQQGGRDRLIEIKPDGIGFDIGGHASGDGKREDGIVGRVIRRERPIAGYFRLGADRIIAFYGRNISKFGIGICREVVINEAAAGGQGNQVLNLDRHGVEIARGNDVVRKRISIAQSIHGKIAGRVVDGVFHHRPADTVIGLESAVRENLTEIAIAIGERGNGGGDVVGDDGLPELLQAEKEERFVMAVVEFRDYNGTA